MIRKLAPALALAALLGCGFPAAAQDTIGPSRVPQVSVDQARRIAADNGMVRVIEIDLKDGHWEMQGQDSTGADVKMLLRASDGIVVKNERERPASADARCVPDKRCDPS